MVWGGTPTDCVREPLHFWNFELGRLHYWILFFSLAAVSWLVAFRAYGKCVGAIVLGDVLGG